MKKAIMKLALIVLMTLVSDITLAGCRDVLELAGREYLTTFINTLKLKKDYLRFCTKYNENKSQNKGFDTKILMDNNMFSLLGNNDKKEAVFSAACQDREIESMDDNSLKLFMDKVNPVSVQAWQECEAGDKKGFDLNTTKVGDNLVQIQVGFGDPNTKSVSLDGGVVDGGVCRGSLQHNINSANADKNVTFESGSGFRSMNCKRIVASDGTREQFAVLLTFNNGASLNFFLPSDPVYVPAPVTCSEKNATDSRIVDVYSHMSQGPDGHQVSCDICGNCRYSSIHVFGKQRALDSACIIDIQPGQKVTGGHDCGGTAFFNDTTIIYYKHDEQEPESIWANGTCQQIKNRFSFERGCN